MNGSLWRGLAMSAAMTLAGGLLTMAPANAAEGVTINLVVTNDFHGQIDDDVVQWAATVEQLLGDGPAGNSLLVSAGDMIGASAPASAAQQDDPTIDVLNALGLDAYAVGNHEFDAGYDHLVNHVSERADFPILGANVTKADGTPALQASAMFTVDGARVAVIGAVTETTPAHAPDTTLEGLNFGEPVAAINSEVDRLNALPEAEQPDVIVAAIHDGAPWGTWNLEQAKEASSMFRSLVEDTSPDVNAIVTGHTHNTYVFNAPVPGADGRTRPVIQTGSGGDNVGQIKLTLNTESGEVTTTSARNVARVSTPDAELIASDPTLAEIAEIRDAAVEYAEARTAAAIEAQQEYETATEQAHTAYADAVEARDDLQQSVTAAKEAHDSAVSIKERYDATVANGKEAYTTAADLKERYNATVANGKQAYTTAADLKQRYDTAVATGKQAYTTAAALKNEYQELSTSGAPDVRTRLAKLAEDYQAAVAAAEQAYAEAAALVTRYQEAIATGKDAYTEASTLATKYQEAIATGKDAYTEAATIKDEYDSAMSLWQAALATTDELKSVFDAAVATWESAEATLETAKDALLDLL